MTFSRAISLSVLALPFLASCRADATARLAVPVIDTLPGGVLSVMSPGPTAWDDTTGWRLIEDLVMGGAPGTPGEIINPIALAVDGEGRIYVGDQSPAAIRQFDRDGNFVRTIGREGAGPGEFLEANLAVVGRLLVVHDARQTRTSLFDTSGAFIRSWPSSHLSFVPIGADRLGRISVATVGEGGPDITSPFIRFDTNGVALDTIVLTEAAVPAAGITPGSEPPVSWVINPNGLPRTYLSVPFTHHVAYQLDPQGGFLFGFSGDYRIGRSADGSGVERSFGRAWEPEPLSDARRVAAVDRIVAGLVGEWDEALVRQTVKMSDVPTSLPAFTRLSRDHEGNVWVRIDGDSAGTRLDVFDSAGAYLGPVSTGAEIPEYGPMVWSRDAVHLVVEAEDGTPRIARYRVER